MKAITIRQPHADLIARGEKFVENRTWQTHHQGWLAIHAGLNRSGLVGWHPDPDPVTSQNDMAFGAIVAVVWMASCIEFRDVVAYIAEFPDMAWLADHEHTIGPWCWVFSSVLRLSEPVSIGGHQNMWHVPKKTLVIMRSRCGGKARIPQAAHRVTIRGSETW